MNMQASDSAVKQILLSLNEEERFIVEDLDDTHVMIAPEKVERVRTLLESEVCNDNHYHSGISNSGSCHAISSWRRTLSV